jgi:hypothetical protein
MSGVGSGSVEGACHTTDGRRGWGLYRVVIRFHDLVVNSGEEMYRDKSRRSTSTAQRPLLPFVASLEAVWGQICERSG